MIARRKFIKAAGAGFVTALLPQAAEAFDSSEAIYASAYKSHAGSFGLAILNEQGKMLHQEELPARGHGVSVSKSGDELVTIARRPGTFALAINMRKLSNPVVFNCPVNRHFYGHGLFSSDERLFYTTENDFENARGIIGIYERRSGYRRIGEFFSGGTGPHEMTLLDGGRILCVANGGIETHPDFGRQKLNLHDMKPSIVFIDANTGTQIEKHMLPDHHHQLSTRHLSVDQKNQVWIGCQYQGPPGETKPVIAKVSPGSELTLPNVSDHQIGMLRNYVGSVSCNHHQQSVAFSSPKGDISLIIDTNTNEVLKSVNRRKINGIAASKNGFIFSSETGTIADEKHNVFWDNHIGTNQN